MQRRTRNVLASVAALVCVLALTVGVLLGGALEGLVPHTPRASDDLVGQAPVVAHRGFSSVAPENTLAAFERAADLGVAFELDVSLAATGEAIVMHDDTLDRTTDGTGAIADTSLDRIRALDAGSWFNADESFAGEPVPTLDEVLQALGGRVVIDIELKTTDAKAELARAVVAAVRRAEAVDAVLVSSFDPFLLEQIRLVEPELRRAQLVGAFEDSDLSWLEKRLLQNLALNTKAQPDILIAGDGFISQAWVERQKARGYTVMAYTINEPERMRELVGWGVDAIITDVPREALETLAPPGE